MVAASGSTSRTELEELLSQVVKNLETNEKKPAASAQSTVNACLTAFHFGSCSSNAVKHDGDSFDFKKQAVPLSVVDVKPFVGGLLTTAPIGNYSPSSSPSGAGIHPGFLRSPRKSLPESPLSSPRKCPSNKGKSKRVKAAASCFKALVADPADFRAVVEQYTAMPRSPPPQPAFPPPSTASPEPLLLDYNPIPQPASQIIPVTADLALLQTPASIFSQQDCYSSFEDDASTASISFNIVCTGGDIHVEDETDSFCNVLSWNELHGPPSF